MPAKRRRVIVAAAIIAAVLGLAHAAVSLYWALGGTALLDTIGGTLETQGREGGIAVTASLLLIAALKVVVALAAPAIAGIPDSSPPSTRGTLARVLSWIAAVTLVLYGGLLTAVGLLVQAGIIEATEDADHKALAWHAYFWDPWFLLWGLALLAVLWLTRGDPAPTRAA